MGTPDFAVPCLERLVSDGHEVAGVFTRQDKPKGRGYALSAPPVKLCAQKYGIPVFQPATLKDGEALRVLRELKPELIVVTAYGRILPPDILFFPPRRSVNIHASLLPKYRGAAPIQRCLLNGETETGVASMLMDEGVDTGDVLLTKQIRISENMTAGELSETLSELGAQVLSETLRVMKAGGLKPVPQDDSLSSCAPMLTRDDCPVDFHRPAAEVHNRVRGLSPKPAAETRLSGRRVKIYRTLLAGRVEGEPGEISVGNGEMLAACGDGNGVRILELQLEGGKRLAAKDFLLGHKIESGTFFE